MIATEKIREGLDRLPTIITGGPGSSGPTEYVARRDVLSMLDKLEGGEEVPCPYCEEIPCPHCEEVAVPVIKAEINRSCTPEQAKAIREFFERGPQGWVEGVDFIDHTDHGTKCFPEYVDVAKLYEAQKIMRVTRGQFCDQCGATNPKHGFYPLHHSHVAWNGELVESVSSVTCNCCHATEKNPCLYCAEEEKTGRPIDVRDTRRG